MGKISITKIVAVVLTFLMIFSSLPLIVGAQEQLKIKADSDLIPGGEGVAFYDDASAGGERGLELDPRGFVILRKNEWLKYDISSLAPGEYIVIVSAANTTDASVNISINDEETIKNGYLQPTSSYFSPLKNELGRINIKDDKTILTITNLSNATYLQTIELVSPVQLQKEQNFYNTHRPYKMSYAPCAVEAEWFDAGQNGISYYDMDEANKGGVLRKETSVDVYSKNGKTYVDLMAEEWVKYTFSVKKSGNYKLIFNWVDPAEISNVRIFANNYEILRSVPYDKVSYGDFKETVIANLYLKEGVHDFVIKCMEGNINIDYFRLSRTNEAGMDISNTSNLRHWLDAQVLSDEDLILDEGEEEHPIEREIYVTSGSKNGNGTKEKPFGTIEEAKAFVNTVNSNMNGDIVINLSGEFKLSETLKFTKEDSGTNDFNVIYKGDNAVIHGGRKVTGWKKAEGTPLYQVTLPDVEDFRQLYVGENRGIRSRSKFMYWMKGEYDDPEINTKYTDGYIMNGADFPYEFSKPLDMELVWHPSWRVVRSPITSISKNADGDYVILCPVERQGARMMVSAPASGKHPYYIENAPEFLDEPGEFYFNKDTKVLSYYPRENENMETIECYIPETEQLLDVRGESLDKKVKNITFKGISFKYGAWEYPTENGFGTIQSEQIIASEVEGGRLMLPAQIQVNYGENIDFIENEFVHLGSCAVSYNKASTGSEVTGNLFDDLSATAVVIGDWTLTKESPKEEYCRKINISSNLIRRAAVEYMTPVISVYQTFNVIADHNDIKDTPCTAITFGWGWGEQYENVSYNHITNNRIDNSIYVLFDGGAIYTLDSNKGGKITGNYSTNHGQEGIYHDHSSSNWLSTNNVFEGLVFRSYLKITHNTIKDNLSYNNYAEYDARCDFPGQNDIKEAIGKTNGEWSKEAQEIMNNAGLSEEYKYLLSEYEAKGNLYNGYSEKTPQLEKAGIYVRGTEWIDGGEGVAYHEVVGQTRPGGMTHMDDPTVWAEYDGTRRTPIGTTAEGEWIKYPVEVKEAGYYDLVLELAVVTEGTCVSVEVDDKPTFTKVELEPNCKDYNTYKDFNMGKIYLEPGIHTVKIEHAVSNFANRALRLVKEGTVEEVMIDTIKPELLSAILDK